MKRIILVLIIIHSTVLPQVTVLSLEECILTGLNNSKELKIAGSNILYAEARFSEAASQMLPNVSLEASYLRLSDIPPFEVNVPLFPAPITIQYPILNSYNIKISLKQPIFTGFRLSSLKNAASLNSKASEAEYRLAKIEKVLRITKAFWDYHKLKNQKVLIEETMLSLNNHLRDTERFAENGLATKNDVLKLKVKLANIRLNLIDAENAVEIARRKLNTELGLPFDQPTEIYADIVQVPELPANFNDLLKTAFEQRGELKSMGLKIASGKESMSASKAAFYPQIFAFGNFYYSRPNQRILPAEDRFNETWDLGLGLQWNIWDWGNSSSKVEQDAQMVLQAEQNLDIIKEGIELQVFSGYKTLLSNFEKIDVVKLAVASAEENYRITNEKYKQQLATSTDLIDAEVDLLKAKTELSNAMAELNLSGTVLNTAIGKSNY
ncbi:MAG: TolC family protein [Melioribacteraceae bacterium]|nr:TolC family protein [Melioribacteraceae bacterium]